MIKYPSVQSTVGKGARIYVTKEKTENEKKVDILTKIFGQKTFSKVRCQINQGHLLGMLYALQTSMMYMFAYFDFCLTWSPTSFMIGNFIFSIITAPFLMIHVFIGHYCNRSYIRVWEMVPLFKGIGYAAMLYQVFMEFFNIIAGGIALLFMPYYFRADVPWKDCQFPEASEKCVPMYPDDEFTGVCCHKTLVKNCSSEYVHFSTYEFFRRVILKYDEDEVISAAIKKLNWPLIGTISFIWMLIYVCMIQGFRRFQRTMGVVLLIVIFITIVPLIVSSITLSHSVEYTTETIMIVPIANFEFWAGLMKVAFICEIPSTYILLGSYSSSDVTPDLSTLIVHGARFFVTTVNTNFLSVSMIMLQNHYKVKDIHCISITALDFMFAVLPDLLSRYPLHQFESFMWFSSIFVWNFCTAACTMTGVVDTLTDTFPKLMSYRLCCCSLLLLGGLFANALLVNHAYLAILYIWLQSGLYFTAVILMMFYLLGLFIYSFKNIMTDYHFLYGVPLKMYWIYVIHVCCLFALGFLILMMFSPISIKKVRTDSLLQWLIYVFTCIILAPIPVYMIQLLARNQSSADKIPLLTPHPNWGPVSQERLQARKAFNPQREMRYKMEIKKCKHNCLLNSTKIKEEIKKQEENRRKLMDHL